MSALYQSYIHQTRYSRYRDDLGRRELEEETVRRYIDYMSPRGMWTAEEENIFYEAILGHKVMPSMRALMAAGPALDRDNAAAYNCCYLVVDDLRAFDETVYLTMCGCGVGFSVERQYVRQLPPVPDKIFDAPDDVIAVHDNRKSWAAAVRKLMAALWAGHCPSWDLSRVRPKGSVLKTFGGRSSGPDPLDRLLKSIVRVVQGAAGRQLTSLECHSLMCMIGSVINSGDVRKAAMISLSNPSDDRLRDAKSGDWHATDPHFAYANNSAAWTDKPDAGRFMKEWVALYESKSGERGIVNRSALQDQARKHGRDANHEFGVNPCGEILLRPSQMCNLSEVVARPDDTLDDLHAKTSIATVLGTVQSTLTDFDYLRPIWKKNCEEERLLGVSITGQMDHPVLSQLSFESNQWMVALASTVDRTNEEWADRLGINLSAAKRCQKPSGNVSQKVDSASGGHARYAAFYIRRTRESKASPIAAALIMAGVPYESDEYASDSWVFEWPMAAPEGAVLASDQTAVDQLERWVQIRRYFTDHNPSATILVGEDEWPATGAWVYDHFTEIGGLSFLPKSDHSYVQAPYEEITEAEYNTRMAAMPTQVDWAAIQETSDATTGAQELACTAGGCEL